MGCHTWFSVPAIKGKDEIIKLAQKNLDSYGYLHESSRKMYQHAIWEELISPCLELASAGRYSPGDENEWILYQGVEEWSLDQYNAKNETSHNKWDKVETNDGSVKYIRDTIELESYSDEPRISGYPEKIIRSYQEMLDFMETGFIDEKGKHHVFSYEESRYPVFMEGIKRFFDRHSEGIITFG